MDWKAMLSMRPAPQQQQVSMLGSGLAQGAADATRLYPLWQKDYIDGNTQLQFTDWLAEQGISNPVLPK